MEAIELVCFKCKHWREINGGCDAFGDDIPKEITSGLNEHSKPLQNQENNIIFEPINEQEQFL
jgi:hypothetical protein